MNRPSLSVASAADPSSGAGRVHDHDPDHGHGHGHAHDPAHDPAHGPTREHDHARSHGHAHDHGHDHRHAHGPERSGERPIAAIRVSPSLIRASLATRLALAAAVAAVIWAGVAWALGPIAG